MAKKKFKELQLLARSQNWALGGMQGRARMASGVCASIAQVHDLLTTESYELRSELRVIAATIERQCAKLQQLQEPIRDAFTAQREQLRAKLESESNGN